MAAIGGSIESVTLAGRLFPVAADAEVQRKIGGDENTVESNGDGTARLLKMVVPLSLAGLTLSTDDARGDQGFLQDLADLPDYFIIAITYASGVTYEGTAQIVGEMTASSANTTTAVSLMGPGTLTPQ